MHDARCLLLLCSRLAIRGECLDYFIRIKAGEKFENNSLGILHMVPLCDICDLVKAFYLK